MGGKNKSAAATKSWVHPPEALLKGHIVYNCKFLGQTEVEEPKGSHVVKDAITKMKFNKQIKRAEGQKPPKVELTVSVDGVTVQEPKYKVMQHRFPLHRISYCADDKSDKRMFTFIAKAEDTNKHHCFVFDSEKCAEEITLTIGQAFDLAYKKFLETSKGDIDQKKQYLLLQKKVQTLTQENLHLKARVANLERLIDPKILEQLDNNSTNGNAVPQAEEEPPVAGKLESLIFDDDLNLGSRGSSSGQTNGSPANAAVPTLAPPPAVPSRSHQTAAPQASSGPVDLFGSTPFNPTTAPTQVTTPAKVSAANPFKAAAAAASDPFGMPAFSPSTNSTADLDQQIQNVDRELMDLQTGFSKGLSFGDDFNLDDLDPLKD